MIETKTRRERGKKIFWKQLCVSAEIHVARAAKYVRANRHVPPQPVSAYSYTSTFLSLISVLLVLNSLRWVV